MKPNIKFTTWNTDNMSLQKRRLALFTETVQERWGDNWDVIAIQETARTLNNDKKEAVWEAVSCGRHRLLTWAPEETVTQWECWCTASGCRTSQALAAAGAWGTSTSTLARASNT